MTTPSYFDRKANVPLRPAASPITPSSPRTPLRGISSTYSSPGNYRAEDDQIVIEFGSRWIRAGLAGESCPRCSLGFGVEESRRVADYRRWLPGYDERPRSRKRPQDWGSDYELWRMDTRHVELGLVEDKLERALRVAYSKYLLADTKVQKAILVIPPQIPHAFLSIILSILFSNFQLPSVTLFAPPAMSVFSAGLRSGLVVDIGWHETTVTAVYEFREVHQTKSKRAMKLVNFQMGRLLMQGSVSTWSNVDEDIDGKTDRMMDVEFDFAEEVLTRIAWCRPSLQANGSDVDSVKGKSEVPAEGVLPDDPNSDELISIPNPRHLCSPIKMAFSKFNQPVEAALFAEPTSLRTQDDEEQTLHFLLYQTLLALPPDVRSVCMSRIMFTGGGSHIPGIKSRLLAELAHIVESRGWDPVWGKAADHRRQKLKKIQQYRRPVATRPETPEHIMKTTSPSSKLGEHHVPPAFVDQAPDGVEEKLRRENVSGTKPTVSGVVRGVETLGAWTGASLAASLRLTGVVEVEKDQFLLHGLAGPRRDVDVNAAKARQSYGPGLTRTSGADATAWTLGPWA